MNTDPTLAMLLRDLISMLPTTDPGGGRLWRDPTTNVPMLGATVLGATKEELIDAVAANVATVEANIANGYAKLDANGLLPTSLFPDDVVDTEDGGTVVAGVLEQTIDDIETGGVVDSEGDLTNA